MSSMRDEIERAKQDALKDIREEYKLIDEKELIMEYEAFSFKSNMQYSKKDKEIAESKITTLKKELDENNKEIKKIKHIDKSISRINGLLSGNSSLDKLIDKEYNKEINNQYRYIINRRIEFEQWRSNLVKLFKYISYERLYPYLETIYTIFNRNDHFIMMRFYAELNRESGELIVSKEYNKPEYLYILQNYINSLSDLSESQNIDFQKLINAVAYNRGISSHINIYTIKNKNCFGHEYSMPNSSSDIGIANIIIPKSIYDLLSLDNKIIWVNQHHLNMMKLIVDQKIFNRLIELNSFETVCTIKSIAQIKYLEEKYEDIVEFIPIQENEIRKCLSESIDKELFKEKVINNLYEQLEKYKASLSEIGRTEEEIISCNKEIRREILAQQEITTGPAYKYINRSNSRYGIYTSACTYGQLMHSLHMNGTLHGERI